jgi:hypothetical protein
VEKKLISIENGKRTEIVYSKLTDAEIASRIRQYEGKYGQSFDDFYAEFDSDKANIYEIGDFLDWESLVEERKARTEKTAYERT